MSLKNVSIKTKLLFSYLVLIFVPMLILTALSYKRVSFQMEDNMLRTSQNALAQSKVYLETKLFNLVNASGIIHTNQTLNDVFIANPLYYDTDLLQQAADQGNLTSLFNQIEVNTDVYKVRLYLRAIDGYYYDNVRFNVFKELDNVRWYERLKTATATVTWIPPSYFNPSDNEGSDIISLCRPIHIKSYNVTEGVIRIDMRESVVRNIVAQANVTTTGILYIVNDNGEMISASGKLPLLDNTALRKAAEDPSDAKNTVSRITSSGNHYIRLSYDIADSDWRFISIIPESEIKSTGNDIRLYMTIVLCITGAFSFMVAYLWFNTTARRLKHLAMNIRKVTRGDFNTQIRISSNDEIGQISHDFNYMVREMEAMIQDRFEHGKKIKSLELRSLQSQIKPHFLYNSLDMINWSAMMSGNLEIGAMVQALSKFYKIGLSKGEDIITVGNEIEHVTAYLELQNFRFENQIQLELNVDKEILHYGILKITLQPLVENAIQHGILKGNRAGIICITGEKKGGILVFSVSDNGIGMAKETLERIKKGEDHKGEYHGYGIKNINDRIKLQYGPAYGLSYCSEPGKGTKATITLPAITIDGTTPSQ